MTITNRPTFRAPQLVATLILAALAIGAGPARAAVEIIPSLGITKSTDASGGDATRFGGLALRAGVLPFLEAEGGVGYRQDSFSGGDVRVRQWPLTASLWVAPLPVVYAGGGVGWYRTTFDYRSSFPIRSSTTQKVGVHLGGGVDVPIGANLGLDLNGRYIFMQKDQSNVQVPTTFNPDFWTLALGLAIKL